MKRTGKEKEKKQKDDDVIFLKPKVKSNKAKQSSAQFDDVQRLVYLLQVHQVELEHQNEELRLVQEELEASRDKYVNLFDFSPIPYFTLNADGIIKEVNLSASRMFGYDRKKFVGRNFKTHLVLEERDVFHIFLNSIFDSSIKQSCEVRVTNKAKREFQVLLEGLKLTTESESEPTCQVALIDLTEYKRIENSLKEANEELKALNETKDKFFSIIAHDLRNPFHSLLGFSEILATEIKTLSNEEIVTFSKGLNEDLRSIYGLLDNLLQWSMIQRSILDYNPVTLDLHNLISKMIAVSRKIAEDKSISIENNVEKGTFVYADADMLRSIIQNLLINAIKFTRKHGSIILSSVEKGNLIEVSVKDSGMGIERKTMSNLFSFDRLSSTTGTAGERGTGLGLPLCKEFVERNDGKIWLESEPGKGSTFIFTLQKSSAIETGKGNKDFRKDQKFIFK
jgi:PAS domain S-box-containing protein